MLALYHAPRINIGNTQTVTLSPDPNYLTDTLSENEERLGIAPQEPPVPVSDSLVVN